jgi:pyrimidine operon attenuation protein / uracil phosphoribosyltransferase
MKNTLIFKTEIFNKTEMYRALRRMSHEIIEKNGGVENLVVVGIKRRGVYLAQRIVDFIKTFENIDVPLGELDISLYLDDLTEIAQQPLFKTLNVSADISGKNVVLVDDVLYTGRTARIALDALIEHGSPAKIELAVLIDRGHRQLPIHADFMGKKIATSNKEIVEVKMQEIDGVERVILVERSDD